MLKNTVYGVEN